MSQTHDENRSNINGQGHSKSLLFLYSPIASKHPVFPLIEVSASEVPAILKKFVSKEATLDAAILKLSWQPGCVYVTSFHPTRNCREGVASITRSAKSIFSLAFILFTIFNAIISEFGACLAQNNMA